MPSYTPPTEDHLFILHEVLKVQDNQEIEGYADLTPDLTGPVLEEAGKLGAEVLAPLNTVGDGGCTLENGIVRTPEGFKAAFDMLRDGGWTSLACDPDFGGQGLPGILHAAAGEYHSSANMAFMMFSGLTLGAYRTIHAYGTEEQKATYLEKMATCQWTGTMNLTEPHCGTDLGMLRTKAVPQGDGSYKLSGQKIFISSGEHDMAENIVHLVLARTPDAPAGVKGISLFIAPKFLPKEDGTPGARNALSCGKLEEKMGIHGNPTCVMNYDEATGWLLGEENRGLAAMFTMMNHARLDVAGQGLFQAAAAYQVAATYAKDRLQGRAVTGVVAPEKAADPLIVHPDVRRLLLDQKSFVEGARAALLIAAELNDASHRHADAAKRKEADDMLSLLTPVLKGFCTDKGFDMTVQAQQVFGGHGYIREWGMEQFVRDARIAMIYEGANGVQALDLVGRKLAANGGKTLMGFFEAIKGFNKANAGDEELAKDFLDPLKAASKDMQEAAMYFMAEGMKNPNNALSGSSDFLHLFGHVLLGWAWARMAVAARAGLASGEGNAEFYRNKLRTGRYYMSRMLPETGLRLARIRTGAAPVMDLPAEAF
ncbi:MAG: acyl-CoA dehydrogenase C-terminal domain-containing protein [Pikeienuella sp.]|uniref:acyl-CoA dehydrogenase C-terminal domain-containing protein n=1 Tax=Pikeienuella sp. TaxID=2831957 RepID=UPI003919E8E5